MCRQTYLTFASCACQLHYHHEPCAHGPASPACRGRRTVLVPARSPLCYQHAYIQQRQARARARDEERQQQKKKQKQHQQLGGGGGFGDGAGATGAGSAASAGVSTTTVGTTLSLFTVGGEAWRREMQVMMASAGRRESWWDA